MNNQPLTIVVNDNGTSFANQPITMEMATNTLMTGLLNIANSITNTIPEEHQQEFKEATYDTFNQIFTAFLETWIPDSELRSDLAADAILELENQKTKEAAEALPTQDNNILQFKPKE